MSPSRSRIRLAADIARHQHGVVTHEQLRGAGWSRDQIAAARRKELLHPIHRGVYRLGHRAPCTEAGYLAAALAGGDRVAVCGFAAAHVLVGLPRRAPAPELTGAVDLRLRGVITRRLATLAAGDVWRCEGVPVTSPARTMVDLAGQADFETLSEISHKLGIRHGLSADAVFAVMAQRGRVNGAAKLRALYRGDAAILLSRLEKRFRALLLRHGLPLPRTNVKHDSFHVDCRWADHGLTVELLGYRFHASRHAWVRDQRRAREAYARGDDFRTYTWDDVTVTPDVVLGELSPLLLTDRAA